MGLILLRFIDWTPKKIILAGLTLPCFFFLSMIIEFRHWEPLSLLLFYCAGLGFSILLIILFLYYDYQAEK